MPSEKSQLKVITRIRPLLSNEEAGTKIKVATSNISLEHGGHQHAFNFDKCYQSNIKTNQIFNENLESLVNKTVLGYNLTIFNLGSCGSGKSFMMTGSSDEPGIIPCVNHSLFLNLEKLEKTKDIFVTVSFLEVCEGELIDVLNPHSEPITIKEHPHFGTYVDGLSNLVVSSLEDLETYYEQGNRARNIGLIGEKNESSKSSAFFYINLELRDKGSDLGVKSCITMVDNSGLDCESNKYSMNPLLSVFKAMDSNDHIPYRDYSETKLLSESFSGNTMTCLIVTISPAEKDRQNALITLQNAKIANKNIKNKIHVNLEETVTIMSEIREEISRLRIQISDSKHRNKEDVHKMVALVADLTLIKKSTWAEKTSLSNRYNHERKINLANKGVLEWVMDLKNLGDKDSRERCLLLQKEKDRLTLEYKEKREVVNEMKEELQAKIQDYSKLAESGKATDGETKTKVTLIHELKERLKKSTEKLKDLKQKLKQTQEKLTSEKEAAQSNASVHCSSAVRRLLEAEERKRMELDDHSMVVDEWERVKLEIQQQKADIQVRVKQGRTYETNEAMDLELELVELKGDKSVIQILQQEKQRLQKSIDESDKRQSEELEIQQLQHLQIFRQYREVFDNQKISLEEKYHHLVNDAIQDAIYLSTRNEQMIRENQALKQEIAELKDALSLKG